MLCQKPIRLPCDALLLESGFQCVNVNAQAAQILDSMLPTVGAGGPAEQTNKLHEP
eukprot:CAMPEP_0204084142 /NCGR_PEP_ID=MMETSP0360-20130528/179649_1 /ASSEMBLY_ACC=CAM_ASM_000342 /TAXON_ID=268821 /ORGANISM="Scrippsiella Hangoei, Strain SHTV-5" /LENGTH=55 /DNA_ID=CAMNT_0051033111 /DNA_START=26 /DNA_END=189 /DNA_ORIENTATION=+